MKKILTLIASFALAAILLLCGCSPQDGRDGRDGKDGENVTVMDLYEAAKTASGNENLTLEEFLKEYLTYDDKDVDSAKSLQTNINKSLMAGVSILSRFPYSSSFGSRRTYKVFTGSGVILWLDREKGDAYVATNCHVVYDDTSETVFCQDVRLYLYGQDESGVNYVVDSGYNISGDNNYRIDAEVVSASISYDIALLKVSGSEVLKRSDALAASFSTAQDPVVGETVYAVGNASGEGLSASDGIVGKDSELIELTLSESDYPSDSDYYLYRVMRTTAAINHGNSGGALYNADGEIAAIVNAKDESSDVDNMGYALPASSVRRLLGLMYDNYTDGRGALSGVSKALLNITTTATDSYSRFNSETGVAEIYETVMIREVNGTPAFGSLRTGDFLKAAKLIGADGTMKEDIKITRRYHLQEMMFSVRKGDTLVVTVERNGEDTDVSVLFNSDSYFTHIN